MEWYMILALIGTGLAAGFINTTAGGGSMLTLPLLMFLGLPANVANGTNRIAILLQNISWCKYFSAKESTSFKNGYKTCIPAVVGSLFGAMFAVEIDPLLLKKVIAGLMVAMFLLVVLKPEVWVKERAGIVSCKTNCSSIYHFLFYRILRRFYSDGSGIFTACRTCAWLRTRFGKSQCSKSVYRADLYAFSRLAFLFFTGRPILLQV